MHALQVALGMQKSAQNAFPYPPAAILLFRPLTLLSYQTTYVVWTLGTLALFIGAVIATCSRLAISVIGVIGVIVAPTTISCIDSGQTGFLAAALLIAKAFQGLVALLVWRCFRQNPGRPAAAALLVGTVLATPHAFIYDLPVVAAAIVLLIQERIVTDPVFSLSEVVILILGFTFPLFIIIQMAQFAPPVSAVPLLLLFGLILRDSRRAA